MRYIIINDNFFILVSEATNRIKKHILVPFLPVNPELSTMRNQGRQKLARLSKEEFVTLVWDILFDCNRRQNPSGLCNKYCNDFYFIFYKIKTSVFSLSIICIR